MTKDDMTKDDMTDGMSEKRRRAADAQLESGAGFGLGFRV
jgi:hypothetical protein